MRAFLSGKMRNKPHFGAADFDAAAEKLRRVRGWEVYNPAEQDRKHHGPDVHASPTGNPDDLSANFDIRSAVCGGLRYICEEADCVVVLPDWLDSAGAMAEVATADAIGLPVWTMEQVLGEQA